MLGEGFEQYFKLGKTFLNPWGDLGKTCMEVCRRTNQETGEVIAENWDRTANQIRRFSNAKRPDEFFNLQKDCLNENISAMMGDFQKLMNISLGSIEEMNKAFTSNIKEQHQASPLGSENIGKKRS